MYSRRADTTAIVVIGDHELVPVRENPADNSSPLYKEGDQADSIIFLTVYRTGAERGINLLPLMRDRFVNFRRHGRWGGGSTCLSAGRFSFVR